MDEEDSLDLILNDGGEEIVEERMGPILDRYDEIYDDDYEDERRCWRTGPTLIMLLVLVGAAIIAGVVVGTKDDGQRSSVSAIEGGGSVTVALLSEAPSDVPSQAPSRGLPVETMLSLRLDGATGPLPNVTKFEETLATFVEPVVKDAIVTVVSRRRLQATDSSSSYTLTASIEGRAGPSVDVDEGVTALLEQDPLAFIWMLRGTEDLTEAIYFGGVTAVTVVTAAPPTASPTGHPTLQASMAPTISGAPTRSPTFSPSDQPSSVPTALPVETTPPTVSPVTASPTASPVTPPPTASPVTPAPTVSPVTPAPTVSPVTPAPTNAPVVVAPPPTPIPTVATNAPITSPPFFNFPQQVTACNGLANLCDQPINNVLFGVLHNANAARDSGYAFAYNHEGTLEAALEAGWRGINVDVHRCGGDVVLAHGPCFLGTREVDTVFGNIQSFLEANPNEVLFVTLQMEDDVTYQEFYSILVEAGVATMLYDHEVGQPWPTLGYLIGAGTRIVLMHYNGPGCFLETCPPGMNEYFVYATETDFQYTSAEEIADTANSCVLGRGATGTKDFYGVNAFVTLPNQRQSSILNQADFVKTLVTECSDQNNLNVNFIIVDFWETGNVLDFVTEYNASL